MHLSEFKWEPENEAADWIWIPSGSGGGQWVGSSSCILHDKNHMFGSQLRVLDKYYETKLLGFFTTILGVRHGPNIEDYCKLWCSWEASLHHPTVLQCSAFWEFIAKHWNAKMEKLLLGCVSKLPVQKNNEILLSNKQDVFIPDDLLQKDLFDKCSESSDEAIFIWYPSTSNPALSRANLNKIYTSIGVRTISEAVEKDESFTAEGTNIREVDPGSLVLKDGLLRIVLAFLCDTSLATSSAERHCIVKNLCNLQVLELDEPISVSYKLSLTTGKNLIVKASKMFCWEKDNAKLFVQSIDGSKRKRGSIRFATFFADVISQGLLFEMSDQIAALSELIRLGCLLDFEEDAVEFLLKTKNLQLFAEDEDDINLLEGLGINEGLTLHLLILPSIHPRRSCDRGSPWLLRREDQEGEIPRWERGEKNPLAEDIHQAVNHLSEELYSKDVHFLMELIQNAEDKECREGVTPSLDFIITSKDVTMSGADSTLPSVQQ
ncbi:hypothetical protein MUK42_24764 [Musa troglodytarum]|uniref:Uncharacterized protein n=1 Tax=Musa troglodytarum TaxID=320322 RepID=A0A9E7L694_9LILI|nr:hypothetical protein MUK42_24764 [Musa troglodytarum]